VTAFLRVECTSEGSTEGSNAIDPAVIWFGSRRVEVRAVVDRWYGRDRRWWKVATDEGQYVLRRDEPEGGWELAAVVNDSSESSEADSQNRPLH